MRYIEFDIRNFKGIKHATLHLTPAGANIFTLIGLNESGKTTILEAINHHTWNLDTLDALYAGSERAIVRRSAEELATLIPKAEKSDFSDNVSIKATFEFDEGEKESLIESVEKELKCVIDPTSIPDRPTLTRTYVYEDSDYKEFRLIWGMRPLARSKQAKKFKYADDDSAVWKAISARLKAASPEIAYFPTFLFNQPDRIYLTEHDGETGSNRLYRQIIENIAASLPKPLDIQRHLVDRLINEETWVDGALSLVGLSKSKQQQITASKNEISAHLTKAVFEGWSKTFGGDFGGREILLNLNVEPKTDEDPLAYATFEIKDDGGQYEIKERSLGFRWFFSFIVFTLFGINRTPCKKTLFLLDEPASNLHSRAQMQLLESFKRITATGNQIIYSTHSHYMINPDWLDQAFIVSNAAIDYDRAYQNDNVGSRTEISAERYRKFVGENPDKITYFQPVLDKLDVTLSKFDLVKKSVLVEGKGDFKILEFSLRHLIDERGDYSIVPTRGATGMDELIGLFLGWSVPFVVCLDDDKEGRLAKQKYIEEWGLSERSVITLADVHKDLVGKRIEGLLEPDDLEVIASKFGVKKVTKSHISLFFSEALARDDPVQFSDKMANRVKAFDATVLAMFT